MEVSRNTLQLSTCPVLSFRSNSVAVASSLGRASTARMTSCSRKRLEPFGPGTKHPEPTKPRSVLAAEALKLISRRKRSKSESPVTSSWCFRHLGPARSNPTRWRCFRCRGRLCSVHSFLQHLTNIPEGFQELSRLFGSFFAPPHSFGHFHHLLDQGRNLLLRDFGLTTQTQTNQESTTRHSFL